MLAGGFRAQGWGLVLALVLAAGSAAADPPAHRPADPSASSAPDEGAEERIAKARALFEEGIARVKRHEWGQALESFRASAELRPHPVTTYNIGACHRAMGRYTRARGAFLSALGPHPEGSLPSNLVEDSKRYVEEIESLLAHVRITIVPADARLAVDGAPLAALAAGEPPQMVAGVRRPGPGERLPAASVEMRIDPGAHVLLLSRKGFRDVALNKTFAAGERSELKLQLDRLPAELSVTANVPRAVVELDGHAVGMAPVKLQQPAGTYRVAVNAEGYEPYESQVSIKPGEDLSLEATLIERTPSILERWWFWTAAGVVITGAVIGTYFATRPDPQRPALDGGGLGWTVPLR